MHISKLFKHRTNIPVAIYEMYPPSRTRRLLALRAKVKKLLFIGKVPVLLLLTYGRDWCHFLGEYHFRHVIHDDFRRILRVARIDETEFQVIDWFKHREALNVHVIRCTRPMITIQDG